MPVLPTSWRNLAVAAVCSLVLGGCAVTIRGGTAEGLEPGQVRLDLKYRVIGRVKATARAAYVPLFVPFYLLFNIPLVEGGYRSIETSRSHPLGFLGSLFPGPDPVTEAARYDALEKVPDASGLLGVRVRTEETSWGPFWLDRTVEVSGSAIQYQ
ncbi:MAG: hypothetical protein VKO64_02455 [Candidatus Sericytochromatia bacterium]|nr:hypothetical protein [Candidatus Sericytochromatia bacterium]